MGALTEQRAVPGNWSVIGSTGASCDRERALRTLYDEHADSLLHFVIRQVGGDRQQAEDIVQETLLRSWRRAEFDGVRSLRPWLFTVARRLAVDTYRRRKARPEEVDGSGLEEQLTADADDIDRMLSSVVLTDALEALSPAHRAVLQETYFRDRSVQEASDALGIPPGTVKSRIHYALRALRLALDERDVSTTRR
jgi:RNA polymerase sigma-70 factor (ECF subfamily)